MRRPERTTPVISTRWRAMPAFVTAVVLAATLPGTTPASAAPEQAPPTAQPAAAKDSFDHDHDHEARDKDNRKGTASPNSAQRSIAGTVDSTVQWNALGTPHALGPVDAGLATGLAADPETAARQYLAAKRDLFGLDEAAVASMERLLVRPIGTGAVVLLRQRFGDLPAGHDGLVSIAGRPAARWSGSPPRCPATPAPRSRRPSRPTRRTPPRWPTPACAPTRWPADDLRQVAVPTPVDGPRAAYEVTLIGKDAASRPRSPPTWTPAPAACWSARTWSTSTRTTRSWAVFPAEPAERRRRPRRPGDLVPDLAPRLRAYGPRPGQRAGLGRRPRHRHADVHLVAATRRTTSSPGVPAPRPCRRRRARPATTSTRSPTSGAQSRCNPERVHLAATQRRRRRGQQPVRDAQPDARLGVPPRLHRGAPGTCRWSTSTPDGLGGDAEQGRAQQGALTGSRNNANQGTPRDGLPPTTNMFLWQPIAGASYPPCVDGDYDMTVIGHEYTHAITNRMIAGPDTGIGGHQGGSMGESWSDLLAAEYLLREQHAAGREDPVRHRRVRHRQHRRAASATTTSAAAR